MNNTKELCSVCEEPLTNEFEITNGRHLMCYTQDTTAILENWELHLSGKI